MGGLIQYFKDTRAELRHVAWPTQTQTIVYTLLVAAISLGIAAYLGLFDFLFTTGLSQVVNNLPATPAPTTETATSTLSSTTPITGAQVTIVPATSTVKTTK
jgi:preprotein translocase SecE subunit